MIDSTNVDVESPYGHLEENDFNSLLSFIKTVVPSVDENIAEDWLIESSKVIFNDIAEGNIGVRGNEYDTLLKQLNWHIRRKGKFGASDMSALYMEFKDTWYPFGDAASIVAEKLCMKPVEPMNGDTSRGVYMEDHIRQSFIKTMAKQGIYLESDDYAKEKISGLRYAGGIPEIPWMDCSPDDIFVDQDGHRYLVDYKCPAESSSIVGMQRDVPDYYQAQLAQEKIMLEYLELPADHIFLVPFSTKEWKAFPVECQISDQMCMDVIEAGNYYSTFIEKKELPRRPPSKNYEFVEQLPDELRDVVLEFALHNKGKLMHEAEEDRLKSRMAELMIINKIDIDDRDKKIGIPLVQTRWQTTRRKSVQALEAELTKLGVDINEDRFFTESEARVISLDRGKYNSYAAIRDGIENFMAGKIANDRKDVVNAFRDQFKKRDRVVVERPAPAKKPKKSSNPAPEPF